MRLSIGLGLAHHPADQPEAPDETGIMSTLSSTEERPKTAGSAFALNRVRIRNYKSIASCDIALKPFTILVGRNGAGKSNFLDALRFVADALLDSLPHAIRSRHGIHRVVRFCKENPSSFAIELNMDLPSGDGASYGFEIGFRAGGGYGVNSEVLEIREPDGVLTSRYRVIDGRVDMFPTHLMPPAVSDRLFLVHASGQSEFRPVFDALTSMNFYNLVPAAMRAYRPKQEDQALDQQGGNIASVFARIERERPDVKDWVASYLHTIVPDISDVHGLPIGPIETLSFVQEESDRTLGTTFDPMSVSDGTLRALGILVAINQLASDGRPIRLVGIEEPETALHPAAAGVLIEALREAATHTQVLVTTHSADLLDLYDPNEDHLLAVESRGGRTEIGPINRVSREALRERLYSAGELLRMDHMDPDQSEIARDESASLIEEGD